MSGKWASPELIADAQSGGDAGAERLIAAVWPRCFRFAASLLGDRSLAQDATQETCIAIHQKICTLHDAAAFDAWLYRILIRECGRVRRRHRDLPATYAIGFPADPAATLDVWRALAQLPQAFRLVTILFYFDDMQTGEIAGILNVPHATVRTRLARARERLRSLLEVHEEVNHHAI
jgi:RNA polymerase sigma-70 factor (ECF subfamily)